MSEVDPKKARQGRLGRPVLIVLVAALALCLLVFVGLGFYGSSQPDENIGSPSDAGVSTAPAEPAPSGAPGAVVEPQPSDTNSTAPAN